MNVEQYKIERFNGKHDIDEQSQFNCLVEEVGELAEAVNEDAEKAELAEELGDIIFVARSIGGMHDINMTAVVNQIAEDNLGKDSSTEGTKVTKSGDGGEVDGSVDVGDDPRTLQDLLESRDEDEGEWNGGDTLVDMHDLDGVDSDLEQMVNDLVDTSCDAMENGVDVGEVADAHFALFMIFTSMQQQQFSGRRYGGFGL